MMKSICVLLAFLTAPIFDTVAKRATFVPGKAHSSMNSALTIRGGAINKEVVAKASLVLSGCHNVPTALAPKQVIESYGIKDPSPVAQFVTVSAATSAYLGAMVAWLYYVMGKSANESIGYVNLTWALRWLHALLNGRAAEFGYPGVLDYGMILIYSAGAYLDLTDSQYATVANKALVWWGLLNGLLLFASPQAFGKVYSLKAKSEEVYTASRTFGTNTIGSCMLIALIIKGEDFAKALGYSWLFHLIATCYRQFVLTEADKLAGVDQCPFYVWIFIMGGFSAALLL